MPLCSAVQANVMARWAPVDHPTATTWVTDYEDPFWSKPNFPYGKSAASPEMSYNLWEGMHVGRPVKCEYSLGRLDAPLLSSPSQCHGQMGTGRPNFPYGKSAASPEMSYNLWEGMHETPITAYNPPGRRPYEPTRSGLRATT
jgi:hypothetical protein